MNYKAIGLRVKSARKKRGITQEQLAELAHLSASHVSKIETGETKLSLPSLVRIANVLDASVDALLTDNTAYSKVYVMQEIQNTLDGCKPYELRVMADTLAALKDSLLRNRPDANDS